MPQPEAPTKIKLKPCPFCGGVNIQHMFTPDAKIEAAHWFFCKGCGASGPTMKGIEAALIGWNDRK